jgi:hypothetical protein
MRGDNFIYIESRKWRILGASIPRTFNHYYHSNFRFKMYIFDGVGCPTGSIRRDYTEKNVARGRKEEQRIEKINYLREQHKNKIRAKIRYLEYELENFDKLTHEEFLITEL